MSFQTCRNAKTSLTHYSICAQIENEINGSPIGRLCKIENSNTKLFMTEN
jgi:hypothetical protein